MKMCNCKHALGYEEETGCAVCGHDGCEYNDTIKQLTARVKELETACDVMANEHAEWYCRKCDMVYPIQVQNKLSQPCPKHGDIMMPTSNNIMRIATLEQQIQQAEKRGYELAKEYGLYAIGLSHHFRTYEEAIAERERGAK